MVAYCLLTLTMSFPSPHRLSRGLSFGERLGSPISRGPVPPPIHERRVPCDKSPHPAAGPPAILVVPMQKIQERLKIGGSSLLTGQEPASAGTQVHRSEDHPTDITTRDRHLTRLSPQRPTGPQGRKRQQIRFIFGRQNAARQQRPDVPANPSFSSPTPDRAATRSDPASRRSPEPPDPAGPSHPRNGLPCGAPIVLAVRGRSSPRRSSQTPAESESSTPAKALDDPRSKGSGGPRAPHPPARAGPVPPCSWRSNCRCSGESRPTNGRSEQRIDLDSFPEQPRYADTHGPLGSFSPVRSTDVVATGICPSSADMITFPPSCPASPGSASIPRARPSWRTGPA